MHVPVRSPSAAAAERGSVAGAIVFGLVLAGVMLGGYLWLQGRRVAAANGVPAQWSGDGAAADKWTRLLGKFLATGPERGTWETRFLSCRYQQYIAPHPSDPEAYLIARVGPDGAAVGTRAISRWLVPRQFFRAPASLFFSNYRRSHAPVEVDYDDGTGAVPAVRVHWRPRADVENHTMTLRKVWFSRQGAVLMVEDQSRTGKMIRIVRRVSTNTGDWNIAALDPDTLKRPEVARPDPHGDPDRALSSVVREAPFAVYVPKALPPGFVLVRASYSVIDDPRPQRQGSKVHLVSQLYSDGLALISVGVAPRGDMNVIENMSNRSMDDTDDPASCPGLPANPRDIRDENAVISLRTDACRTVLRRDDLAAVSVTLIARNELPVDEYLRMMSTLELER